MPDWVNQQNKTMLEETTRFEFSGSGAQRIIDRITELKADTTVLFTDAKDGLLGLRLTRELQIPNTVTVSNLLTIREIKQK